MTPLNLLVDAFPMKGLLTGICRYLRCLYAEMEKLPGASISYFDGKRILSHMPPQTDSAQWRQSTELVWKLPDVVVTALRAVHKLRFESLLRTESRGCGFHLYHETAFTPASVSGFPQVFSLYDLSLIKHRQEHPRERVWFFDMFFKRSLPKAAHILTISQFMREEILEALRLPPERVSAIPLAPDGHFFPRPKEQVRKVLKERGWPDEYLLFVGTLEPRKNLSTLIEALGRMRHRIPLILAGWSGWGAKEWQEQTQSGPLRGRVHVAGHVDDETLACLYSGATAFVYPSLYEGFGLPLLEAMACGCPVVASNAASLPEVAGDAAVFFPPLSSEALAAALDTVVEDDNLRDSLRDRGFVRARSFSWSRSAAQTLELFRRIASR